MIKKLPAELEFLLEENDKDWDTMSLEEKMLETEYCIWRTEANLEEYCEDFDSKEKANLRYQIMRLKQLLQELNLKKE